MAGGRCGGGCRAFPVHTEFWGTALFTSKYLAMCSRRTGHSPARHNTATNSEEFRTDTVLGSDPRLYTGFLN